MTVPTHRILHLALAFACGTSLLVIGRHALGQGAPDPISQNATGLLAAGRKHVRTAPLAGIFSRLKGGFYHDGRFATLDDVVNHYDGCMNLRLSSSEKSDLVQYLLTL